MTCVKRMSFLIVLSSLIQLPTSEATELQAQTFDEIKSAINTNTAVTITLTADIESFTQTITIGTGKTVTIVSVDGQKTLTAASSMFFNVEGSLTLERITLNNV